MKKILIALTTVLLACIMCLSLAAEDGLTTGALPGAEVYVTVVTGGSIKLARKAVTVTDVDNDGVVSICDALYIAHEDNFTGGAAAGFGFAATDYGISMTKLWGAENGGSYGYYLNNASPMSMLDAVKTGDSLTAFAYADPIAWSDVYSYFDLSEVSGAAGDTVTLTLSCASFDADWNPVTLPVCGAVITLGGVDTAFTTDAGGKAVITLSGSGRTVISARSDSAILVPPVCLAEITSAADGADTASQADDGAKSPSPTVYIIVAVVLAAAVLAIVLRNMNREKK